MPNQIGKPREFYKEFKFRVFFDGVLYAGFSECSELTQEIATILHYEGGSSIPNKSRGRVSFPDITLKQGATNDLWMYNWLREVCNPAAGIGGVGLPESQFKRNGEIIQLGLDDRLLQRWTIYQAWPNKGKMGAWNNGNDGVVISEITLAYDYFEPQIKY